MGINVIEPIKVLDQFYKQQGAPQSLPSIAENVWEKVREIVLGSRDNKEADNLIRGNKLLSDLRRTPAEKLLGMENSVKKNLSAPNLSSLTVGKSQGDDSSSSKSQSAPTQNNPVL
jgi:hypothetical protein